MVIDIYSIVVNWNPWSKMANLIMVVLVTVLSLNRIAWSILLMYDPLKYDGAKMTFHMASFGITTFLIHMLDQYIREVITYSSSSECSWNFRIGGVLLALSYFAVWLFYWHRHRQIYRVYKIRLLSNIGLAGLIFCFIILSVGYLLFCGGRLENGTCFLNKQFWIGSSKWNSGIVVWVTIGMDIICSGYLCLVFLVPLLRSLTTMEQRNEDQRVRSSTISTQNMKKSLQRAGLAAVLSLLSTSLSLILLRAGSTWNWTLNEEVFFVNVDGLLTTYSIHISFAKENRWFWSWFKSRKINNEIKSRKIDNEIRLEP